MLILFIIPSMKTSAAKYVTVATIGNAPDFDKTQDPQKLVGQVIAFWNREIKQVLPDKPDLIVLPEVCDLTNAGEEYRKVCRNQILDYLGSVARTNHCNIAYGTLREDQDKNLRNSCVIIDRNGKVAGIYDKNFPTIGEMEKGIKPGREASVFQLDFGKVGVAICFDLNYDELREQYAAKKPDLIIFSSVYHGGLAQNIWAFSCRSHFVGSVYKGNPSEIRNPMGEIIASSSNYQDFVVTRINLDCKLVHLDYNQGRLKELKAKYGPGVTISDPGRLGSVLVTSEDKNVTVDQMIREFRLELLDDYFNRSREFRSKNLN